MVFAILTKESAYVLPLLLAFLLFAKRQLTRSQARTLVVFFLVAAALFVHRCWLFGDIGGYRDPLSGKPQVFNLTLSTCKALLLRIWTALCFPIDWSNDPGMWLTVRL